MPNCLIPAGLGYIKTRKRFNNEKQQCISQSKDNNSGLSGRVPLKEI